MTGYLNAKYTDFYYSKTDQWDVTLKKALCDADIFISENDIPTTYQSISPTVKVKLYDKAKWDPIDFSFHIELAILQNQISNLINTGNPDSIIITGIHNSKSFSRKGYRTKL